MEQKWIADNESIKNNEEVKSFVRKFAEKSKSELSDIITRYISYRPETVEAALIVSVDRGIISYDVKELLLRQIEENFKAHSKNLKQKKWEDNNAFVRYVSGYQDDEIYNIIDDPSGIVIDAYHAILLTAKERELISEDDFNKYYKEAKTAIRYEDEIRNDEINDLFGTSDSFNVFENDINFEAEKEKYWKCPSCGQLVDMELGICWNCQAELPAAVEHPNKEEIVKELTNERIYNPVRAGFLLIVAGILIGLFGLVKGYSFHGPGHYRYGRFIFGVFFTLLGIVFIIAGQYNKSKTK